MEWVAWGIVFFILWGVSALVITGLIAATSISNRCTCLGDYDDDNDRTCARCHE